MTNMGLIPTHSYNVLQDFDSLVSGDVPEELMPELVKANLP